MCYCLNEYYLCAILSLAIQSQFSIETEIRRKKPFDKHAFGEKSAISCASVANHTTLHSYQMWKHPADTHLKELGLEASKGATDPEIQLLPSVNRHSLVLVGLHQLGHGGLYVFVCDSAELGTEYRLQLLPWSVRMTKPMGVITQ